MTDFENTPKYKLHQKICMKFKDEWSKDPNESFEEIVKNLYLKDMESFELERKTHPYPEYLTYDDLEEGKVYHISSGLCHNTFKVHEKIVEDGITYYTCSMVKLSTHDVPLDKSYYTTKFKMGTWNQMTALYQEGPYPFDAVIIQ